MDDKQVRRPAIDPSPVEQASPAPAPLTDKERQQIAEGQARAKRDQEELRARGFGDHKGTEGF